MRSVNLAEVGRWTPPFVGACGLYEIPPSPCSVAEHRIGGRYVTVSVAAFAFLSDGLQLHVGHTFTFVYPRKWSCIGAVPLSLIFEDDFVETRTLNGSWTPTVDLSVKVKGCSLP